MRLIILAFSSLLFATSPLLGQIEDFPQTDFKKADSIAQLYP